MPRAAAASPGIAPSVVGLSDANRNVLLLSRRWEVERQFSWTSRFRRLARDRERLAGVPKGFHLLASAMITWEHAFAVMSVLRRS